MRGYRCQRLAQLRQSRPLTEHAVDIRRHFVVGHQARSPAGQQNHRCARIERLDGGCNRATIEMRHTKIGDHSIRAFSARLNVYEGIDAGLAPICNGHEVTASNRLRSSIHSFSVVGWG